MPVSGRHALVCAHPVVVVLSQPYFVSKVTCSTYDVDIRDLNDALCAFDVLFLWDSGAAG